MAKVTTAHQRRIDVYFPSAEERDEFTRAAKESGLSKSGFVFHLYRLFRQGKLNQTQSPQPQQEEKRVAS
jgi:hypothetical protein